MLTGPTFHGHVRQMAVQRRLRWLTVALAAANIVLWSAVFGL